ncbi:MAG: sigma-54-dependent Fis family transcriptional regulator [Alphaproteobacteria bacterium CG11_big_fil_rev_8_21_14_0_20_44_7]|nr:MAG: sigma-54-dependent Fis family transcriptional regulator [Alphaproteobacteria bacterium CG11_big_fil_rev_8_21_14_0_20_44_7]
MTQTILLVEDEVTQRMMVSKLLEKKLGYRVREAANGKEAKYYIEKDENNEIDLLLLDLNMPEMDGFETMEQVAELRPDLPIIVLTGSDKVEDAIRAIKLGAADFLTKPVEPERLQISIQNALKINNLSREVSRLRRRDSNALGFSDIVGHNLGLKELVRIADKGAKTAAPILISGETGVGKELFARAIHGESQRHGEAFIAVNCAAIPDKLVESTLFGHEKGSFTGAISKSLGKFREAEGGTLFLDEVGELPLETQAKLLRALQQKEIEPVGSGKSVKVNIRIISATNRDLSVEVAQGKFRDDLLFRLNVFPIEVPALRKHKQDIIPLAQHFLEKFSISEKVSIKGITAAAENRLMEHSWPGNVRELENSLYRAVILCDGEMLDVEDVENSLSISAPINNITGGNLQLPVDIKEGSGEIKKMELVEQEVIQAVIDYFDGNIAKAAKELGIAKSTIYRKLST